MLRIKGENQTDWQEIKATIFPDLTSQVWKIQIPESTFVDIKWNFESEAELIHLAQLSELLRKENKILNLYVPYLPYARQDKEVSNDKTFARTTLLNIISRCNFKNVVTFDVHSNCIQVKNTRADEVIQKVVDTSKPDVIFYPDEGALSRYGSYTNMKYKLLASAYAEKVRDQATGNIVSYQIVSADNLKDKNVLIVDDICDYGRTFIEATKKLKKSGANNIDLFVSHGLFSGGKQVLHDAGIRNIYTTNSLPRNKDGYEV